MKKLIGLMLLAAMPRLALAHGLDTAFLELVETRAGAATMAWRSPSAATGARPRVPEGCRIRSGGAASHWILECPGGLRGRTLEVEGLGAVVSDVVVRVALADGSAHSTVLRARAPSWAIPDAADESGTLLRYAGLGVSHIASGADHLLFLTGLVLALRRWRGIVWAETAFTVSHTLSFTLTALGLVHMPSAAVETAIALSLVLVARDLVRQRGDASPLGTAGLAFVFGAVHGLGFAGGLRELGLPETDVARALVGFAGGVELGQLAFVLLAWALVRASAGQLPRLRLVGGGFMGILSAAWLFERAALLFP